MLIEFVADHALKFYHATPEDMAGFRWPAGINAVHFYGDYLDELVLPEGVEVVVCSGLGLRKLVLPSTAEFVYATGNCLRDLEVPAGIIVLELSDNPLYDLRFRGGEPLELGRLLVSNTLLAALPFWVHEDCLVDATGCHYLTYVTRETSLAVRKHYQEVLEKPNIIEEPDHWVIVQPGDRPLLNQQERRRKALNIPEGQNMTAEAHALFDLQPHVPTDDHLTLSVHTIDPSKWPSPTRS